MPGDERPPGTLRSLSAARPGALRLLERGTLEPLGLLPRSTNYTYLARVVDGDEQALAVYKPRAGEAPLWDFPEGTLGRREVAAFVLADELGWPRVPPTVLREGPAGPGSVQLFVEFDPREHFFTMQDTRVDEFRRIALFDVVANNADRKSGHCLLSADGEVFSVDHGVCFHVEPKLRTVIWDYVGEPIARDLLEDLAALRARLAEGPLRATLAGLLSDAEVSATERRLGDLVERGRFPEPGPGRPYPWPVV